ncbi:calcium-transporting ATPase 2, plasma membrane-type [Ziziphus jujuba]|uniref:Calcium-transporting ATPase 2, plasma membrane-type n=2 Tax=Ziziphus jujuba TaxID=326968 RepID=A0ABM3I7N8_ZIZJJ|nr:calcium-transporting ATPase 2, plasma membrane-type [Ziziphus jujuba]KAH7511205.1 hypothetical protein FEM48_ZijujUnG0035600 [Ziziphus jujuba var. spinosa]
MESYLSENFGGEMKEEYSPSSEALQRWRKACSIVKNPRRRFRFTSNLCQRDEQAAIRRSSQEKLRIAVLVSKAALQFLQGAQPSEYTVPGEVEAAGFQICADELASIVKKHDTKKLQFHGGVAGIAKKLSTSIENGLADDHDLGKHRQEIYGINKFSGNEPQGVGVFVRKALQDMTFRILGLCAFVSLLVGIATEGWPRGADDGLRAVACILLVVFGRAIKGYGQSLRSKQTKNIDTMVTRNGYEKKISGCDLVPGDIVHLSIGDLVPADGLFVSGFSMLIDESSLTGKSELVMVNPQKPFLLSGTVLHGAKLQYGLCNKMMVTAVGMRTQLGNKLTEGGADEVPWQLKLIEVANIIGKKRLFCASVTCAVLLTGLFGHRLRSEDAFEVSELFALAVMTYI